MVFDLLHESIQDNLDLFGHLAMESEGEEQLKYYRNFQQFYEFLPEDGQLEYGRVYTRHRMLLETVDLTVGLLLLDENVDTAELGKEFDVKPVTEWTRNDWKQLKKGLSDLLDIILTKGAVVGINDPNDESVCEERANAKRYNIERIYRAIDICAVLAPLRAALNDQLAEKKTRGTPKVSRNIVTNLRNESEKLEDPNLMGVVRALVAEDESTGDLKMKSIGEVRNVLENDQLSVERTANKTLERLKIWNKCLFEKPRLYPFHFDDSDDEAEEKDDDEEEEEEEEEEGEEEEAEAANAAVRTLRSSRARLMESIEDPLQEAVAAAAKVSSPREARALKRAATRAMTQADDEKEEDGKEGDDEEEEYDPFAHIASQKATKSSPKSSSKKRKHQDGSSSKKRKHQQDGLYVRRKSATQMRFDDDEEEEDYVPDPPAESGLSDLPDRAAAPTPPTTPKRKSQQKSYPGRRVWTDAEKDAIREGIRVHGLGKWAMIKKTFEVVLQHRTSGQIKDCFRTMKNRGELGNVLDTE